MPRNTKRPSTVRREAAASTAACRASGAVETPTPIRTSIMRSPGRDETSRAAAVGTVVAVLLP